MMFCPIRNDRCLGEFECDDESEDICIFGHGDECLIFQTLNSHKEMCEMLSNNFWINNSMHDSAFGVFIAGGELD